MDSLIIKIALSTFRELYNKYYVYDEESEYIRRHHLVNHDDKRSKSTWTSAEKILGRVTDRIMVES